ncbi:murein hydrolase regulator LrgA [Lactobacillus sp. XV13L]|nr:murein hydrolase regulator LrgA [Lactobacillus sp. XV13L]
MQEPQEIKKSAPILIQMLIYATIFFVAQLISTAMPKSFPLPPAVVGLVLMYLLLTFKVIKVQWVDSFGAALIGIIGALFVPSGISLAANLKVMQAEGIKIIIVILLATVILLVVTAYTTRLINGLINIIFHKESNATDSLQNKEEQ